jgi:hypothetical protein
VRARARSLWERKGGSTYSRVFPSIKEGKRETLPVFRPLSLDRALAHSLTLLARAPSPPRSLALSLSVSLSLSLGLCGDRTTSTTSYQTAVLWPQQLLPANSLSCGLSLSLSPPPPPVPPRLGPPPAHPHPPLFLSLSQHRCVYAYSMCTYILAQQRIGLSKGALS